MVTLIYSVITLQIRFIDQEREFKLHPRELQRMAEAGEKEEAIIGEHAWQANYAVKYPNKQPNNKISTFNHY